MIKRFVFIFSFLLNLQLFSYSQELEWSVNLHGFADNQEFSKAGLPAPTNFGIRFSPEVGLRADSTHRIRIGFNSLREFGDKHQFIRKVEPIIYYNYHKESLNFYIGSFPRYQQTSHYPQALLKYELQYFRPNIEGFLFEYKKANFNQMVWVDWTSKQSDFDREGFIIGASGQVKSPEFYLSHFFTLWHNALTSNKELHEHIQDNAAFALRLGRDFSEKTFLDSLDINIGGLISLDRLRNVYDWRSPKGFLFSTYMRYKSFFLHDEFYIGEKQSIGYGSEFFNSKRYNRLDFGWQAFSIKNLQASLLLSFHFTPGVMSNQQLLSLRYNLGGSIPLKRTRSHSTSSLY